MTPRCLRKTLAVLTSPGRPLAREPAVPEVEAECGGEEGDKGDQDGEGGEDAPWHGAATGDTKLRWSLPTEPRDDHAAQYSTAQYSAQHAKVENLGQSLATSG